MSVGDVTSNSSSSEIFWMLGDFSSLVLIKGLDPGKELELSAMTASVVGAGGAATPARLKLGKESVVAEEE
jgi:hypothetical protein